MWGAFSCDDLYPIAYTIAFNFDDLYLITMFHFQMMDVPCKEYNGYVWPDTSRQFCTEYRDAFTLFDKRGDNKIDSDQIGDIMRALGLNPTQADVKKIVQEVDPNGETEGLLSYSDRCVQLAPNIGLKIRLNS